MTTILAPYAADIVEEFGLAGPAGDSLAPFISTIFDVGWAVGAMYVIIFGSPKCYSAESAPLIMVLRLCLKQTRAALDRQIRPCKSLPRLWIPLWHDESSCLVCRKHWHPVDLSSALRHCWCLDYSNRGCHHRRHHRAGRARKIHRLCVNDGHPWWRPWSHHRDISGKGSTLEGTNGRPQLVGKSSPRVVFCEPWMGNSFRQGGLIEGCKDVCSCIDVDYHR